MGQERGGGLAHTETQRHGDGGEHKRTKRGKREGEGRKAPKGGGPRFVAAAARPEPGPTKEDDAKTKLKKCLETTVKSQQFRCRWGRGGGRIGSHRDTEARREGGSSTKEQKGKRGGEGGEAPKGAKEDQQYEPQRGPMLVAPGCREAATGGDMENEQYRSGPKGHLPFRYGTASSSRNANNRRVVPFDHRFGVAYGTPPGFGTISFHTPGSPLRGNRGLPRWNPHGVLKCAVLLPWTCHHSSMLCEDHAFSLDLSLFILTLFAPTLPMEWNKMKRPARHETMAFRNRARFLGF